MPMRTASAVTLAATSSDVRAPWMTPVSTSRPRSSVPKAWARDGGDSGWATVAKGSAGASVLARIASAMSASVRTRPTAPPGVLNITSLVPNTRIEPHIGEIRQEISSDDRHRGKQEQTQQHRDVSRLDGRQQELSQSRPGEHRLDENRAGHDEAGAAADHGH